jgi:hypothetical protein
MQVITAFNSQAAQKSAGRLFSCCSILLHLNKLMRPISAFQQIEKMNASTDRKYFVEETDFYLALAYIKAGRDQLKRKSN